MQKCGSQCLCGSRRPQLISGLSSGINFGHFVLGTILFRPVFFVLYQIDNVSHCTQSPNQPLQFLFNRPLSLGKLDLIKIKMLSDPNLHPEVPLQRWTSCPLLPILLLSFSMGMAKRISSRQLFDRLPY